MLADIDTIGRSHPARGAWIEILALSITSIMSAVAPRKGCVD